MITRDLVAALSGAGHEVETIEIPFESDPERMLEQMLAVRLFDVSEAGERLISIRTPSHLLEHPNKVAWFIHHERLAYDLWGTRYHGFPANRDSVRIRDAIVRADSAALESARRIFTNSKIVQSRLAAFNGLDSTVLYPPLGDTSGFRCDAYGDFVFYPSRLAPIKRQDLLVSALAHTDTDVRLVLAGRPDYGTGEADRLRALIARLRLEDRVELLAEWIPEQRKRDLFATALAGAYVAFDEDSYGYTSLESCHARKPILTCTDSGGVLELVEDGIQGRVVAPEPATLAAAMDELFEDRAVAQEMGEAAARRIGELGISWDKVVEELTR